MEGSRGVTVTSDNFVQLERTFHELSEFAHESDDIDLGRPVLVGERLRWSDLVKEYRVIILAEAGSGKTSEVRAIASSLRDEDKAAFFLRLEHIPDDFEIAFEVGSPYEFNDWLAGSDEGWLFLDSVDEARLRSPRDFELAIRKLGHRIVRASERAHIVITGRTTAWRPKTDLAHCVEHLPGPRQLVEEQSPDAPSDNDPGEQLHTETRRGSGLAPGFKIVTLDDLGSEQIAAFVAARGVRDAKDFLEEIERADAWSFTARPQDLDEVAGYWLDKGRIGDRLEIMRNSIDRRLSERDQSRAEARPLASGRAREGAKLLAATATLSKTAIIRVPDGSDNSRGFPVGAVLPDWNSVDQLTLLSRPIFDEAIYGTVRFHHRSVREYLAAEWFAGCLERNTSRRAIEALFFREQYGRTIVTPTLRPILPWLAILDDKIRTRTLQVAPEIAFEGGDPSRWPFDDRHRILCEVCEQIANGTTRRSAQDYAAVQRFANADLVSTIRELLVRYSENEEVSTFLLRMIWIGRLEDLLPEVLRAALSPATNGYQRTVAFRALRAVGSKDDKRSMRQSFIAEAAVLDRDLLAELIENVDVDHETSAWLLACLEKTEAKERFSVDVLAEQLPRFIERASLEILPGLAEGLNTLLGQPPVIERRHHDTSQRFEWLLVSAAKAAERLIVARHPASLEPGCLGILRKLSAARGFQSGELSGDKADFAALVPAWPELNRALFWFDVEQARAGLAEKGGRIADWWDVSPFGSFWQFQEGDFDYVAGEIARQNELDNKLVALTLAFAIYRKAGRPRNWRERLKRLAPDGELFRRLSALLRPAARPAGHRFRAQERRWKKQQETRRAKVERNHAGWKKYLKENHEDLRAKLRDSPGVLLHAVRYLFERARRERPISKRWTEYNWQNLIGEFGEEVARFYRDAAVSHWRHYVPKLRSEGELLNQTSFGTILGLVGLEIEAHETDGWPGTLTHEEVGLACRYASFELNGFPAWFPQLFAAHPDIVADFLLKEVRYELTIEKADTETHYILSDLSWSAQWAWPYIAPDVYEVLRASEPVNLANLDKMLRILQGSPLADAEIAALALEKCGSLQDSSHLARWFAVWTGVDPAAAIPSLSAKLAAVGSADEQTVFAMVYVTSLLGDRKSEPGVARQSPNDVASLKALHILMHKHIRPSDDIHRAGTGMYSPGLRDDAQDARDRLLDLLRKTPGKDAFLALNEIADAQPGRPWLMRLATGKAEADGDLDAFSPTQVRELHDRYERTPSNHRELADLAAMRLHDLKDDLENGDSSIAAILKRAEKETDMRKYIGNVMRDKAMGRYSIPQEEELADSKKPDLRFHGVGFDAPVPAELKLVDKWSGRVLFERLENQLCGDYLRDGRSMRGIFVLVRTGSQARWDLPDGLGRVDFDGLVDALQKRWTELSPRFPGIDDISVIGIDLTKRGA